MRLTPHQQRTLDSFETRHARLRRPIRGYDFGSLGTLRTLVSKRRLRIVETGASTGLDTFEPYALALDDRERREHAVWLWSSTIHPVPSERHSWCMRVARELLDANTMQQRALVFAQRMPGATARTTSNRFETIVRLLDLATWKPEIVTLDEHEPVEPNEQGEHTMSTTNMEWERDPETGLRRLVRTEPTAVEIVRALHVDPHPQWDARAFVNVEPNDLCSGGYAVVAWTIAGQRRVVYGGNGYECAQLVDQLVEQLCTWPVFYDSARTSQLDPEQRWLVERYDRGTTFVCKGCREHVLPRHLHDHAEHCSLQSAALEGLVE